MSALRSTASISQRPLSGRTRFSGSPRPPAGKAADNRCAILLESLPLQARASEWLFDGRSGIGKPLLRTLAGLWPYYHGSFRMRGRSLFLPQRPYLPHDSLQAVLAYPYGTVPDNTTFDTVLCQVGLAHLLVFDPDAERKWHKILSGGEQQRLNLARVLLHRPQILFLDEATNQLRRYRRRRTDGYTQKNITGCFMHRRQPPAAYPVAI